MPKILLNLTIDSPVEDIYKALLNPEGLRGWWTNSVETKDENIQAGSVMNFKFKSGAFNSMKVIYLDENKEVLWECLDGAKQWIGTKLKFIIEKNGPYCLLKFSQTGWEKDDDYYASCSFGWGYYLNSMRKYLKNGKGNPDSGPEVE